MVEKNIATTTTVMKQADGGRNKSTTSSTKAGLQFPVARIARYLKEGRYAERLSVGAAVYLAAVLEYLTAELLEISGSAAKDNKKKRIIPRHITLAIGSDEEFKALTKDAHISGGGVVPHIHSMLVPKRSATNTLEKSLNTSTEEAHVVNGNALSRQQF